MPGKGMKFQLSSTSTSQTDVPGISLAYKKADDTSDIEFIVDTSLMYVQDFYTFYIHASTSLADFYWEYTLNLFVICGVETSPG